MSQTRFTRPLNDADIVLRAAIVALALATAYIHLTLGGLLFTLNAIGYAVGAAAMVVPLAIAVRYRWLVRLGLASYAAMTIIAWAVEPALYPTAYLAKAIELALIGLLAVDLARRDRAAIGRIWQERSLRPRRNAQHSRRA